MVTVRKLRFLLLQPVDTKSHGVKRPSAKYAHGNLHPLIFLGAEAYYYNNVFYLNNKLLGS